MQLLQALFRFGQTFIEQRRAIRDHVCFCAWIANDTDARYWECTVLDVSDTGARIVIPSPTRISKEFWLVLSKDGSRRRRCQLVWRSDSQIGLKYIGPLQSHQMRLH
jgi:hypothetical protein